MSPKLEQRATQSQRVELEQLVWQARLLSSKWGLDKNYGFNRSNIDAAIVESVAHELCHAVCLGIKLAPNLSRRIAQITLVMSRQARDYQEIMTMAAESLVLSTLHVPIPQTALFLDGSTKVTHLGGNAAVHEMARLQQTHIARRRANRVVRLLTPRKL